jgi:hypothetical protein
LLFDFGNEFPTLIDFGNLAIAEVINSKRIDVFQQAVSQLDKFLQKRIVRRLRFIIERDIKCVALTKFIVPNGLDLFARFVEEHNPKENLRNSINDMMILATAINENHDL